MRTRDKEQILLRLEPAIASLVRERARRKKKSVNKYFLSLVMEDLRESNSFPKVSLPQDPDKDLLAMAGDGRNLPTDEELMENVRLAEIWNR